jgi:hypothetical protein
LPAAGLLQFPTALSIPSHLSPFLTTQILD